MPLSDLRASGRKLATTCSKFTSDLFPAGQFRTSLDQRYTVLELPYLGRSLSLLVVLPSERKTPLSSVESQLTARQMALWDTGLRRTKMDVFLPRLRRRANDSPNFPNVCSTLLGR